MSFTRRILDLILGERGPADIERTRADQAVIFRLPNQRHQRGQGALWLIVAPILGALLYTVVRGNLDFPPEQGSLSGPFLFVGVIFVITSAIIGRWRFVWHYEISLTADILAVDYVSSFHRWRLTTIELASIQQLIVVRQLRKSFLQAESVDAAPCLLLKEQDHDLLVRLAHLLAAEHSPDGAAWRVAIESPLGVQPERSAPPLNSKVVLTQHETDVALDFPLPEDRRDRERRKAWRTFEAGILILVGTLIAFVICAMREWRDLEIFLRIPFVVGLICLVAAASQSWSAWQNTQVDEELRQLSVVGNMLIRTSRDHRKKVWYRHEIAAIKLDEKIETHMTNNEGGSTPAQTYLLTLLLELHNGEKAILLAHGVPHPTDDYRPKAELEWIATELRRALGAETTATPAPAIEPDAAAHAIQEHAARARETRISS